uniref:Uncharacterized protein n=1 Tax=Panagrolaimus sp. ES5 TaxID=591445 RepID=A0AC34FIK4_9BILA
MNEFFDTAEYGLELDTQNGEFISRSYKNEQYIGYYGLAHSDSDKSNYVASFWCIKDTDPKNVKFMEDNKLENVELVKLEKTFIELNDAVEIKNFLQSKFSIDFSSQG